MLKKFAVTVVLAPVALAVLLCSQPAQAQELGNISGVVTDASGSAIPNAQVAVTNEQTGVARNVVTNSSGHYNAPDLVIGKYSIAISAKGFKSYRQTGIPVNVNANLRIDARLQVGEVQQTVEVQANAVQIQTEDATVGQVVNSTQVENLSVNGRNFTSLAALVPGASSTQPSMNTPVGVTSNTSIEFNGMRQSNNVWRMDGQENYDRGCGGCVVVLPSMEAIAEFRVQTANTKVGSGFGDAGEINVVTKSGTRHFHGELWEFFRNDKLDANTFFNNLNDQPKPPLRFNVYGWNLGGPFFIPKLYPRKKSKTFFFFNEEWRKLREASGFNVPTFSAAERTGDFSALGKPIINPTTGKQFPGNIIPPQDLDPNALILAQPNLLFPLPTNPNGNYTQSFSVPTDLREEIVRVDQTITDKEQAFVRYIQETNHQNFTNNLWSSSSYPTTTTLLVNKPKLLYAHLTSMLSPTTVNEASLGYTDQPLDLSLHGNYQRPAGLSIPLYFPNANTANKVPNLAMQQTGVNIDTASWPWVNELETWTIQDNISMVRGSHTFTFGGIWMHFNKQQDLFGPTQGAYTFNGRYTGYDFADFLLGDAYEYQQLQQQTEPNYLSRSGALYAGDTWRATSNLTVTLGVRWDAFPHAYTEKNDVSSFYLNLYNPADAPTIDSTGRIVPNTGNLLNGIGIAGKDGIPRGLVENHWNIFEPRVGIAWRPFDPNTVIRTGFGMYYERVQGNDIYNVAPNPPFSNTATLFNSTTGIPSDLLSNPGGGSTAIIPASLQVYDPAYPTSSTTQWNFGIEHQLASNVVANVTYVGTKGTHLSDNRNINQPYPAGAAQVLAGTANVNQVRPFLGYAAINQYYNGGNSSYNSLQASLRANAFHGLTLQASYTYSHSIDDVDGDVPGNAHQDAYAPYLEYGSSGFDRRQILILSYIYDIPSPSKNAVIRAVLGNWVLSGISTFETGTPINISLPGDNAGIGGAPYRPDLVGDPAIGGGSREEWFNPNAFAQPPLGAFGNAGRNVVRAAGINNTDASLFRNFPHVLGTESSGLQFRAEFYNIFNHTNFSSFGTTFGSPNFGQATAARDPRTIQLGLRLSF